VLPAPTSDISGSGGPVTPPEPPAWAAYPLPWPEPPEPAPIDLGGPRGPVDPLPPWALIGGAYPVRCPRCGRARCGHTRTVEPPPEPELPPSGDWAPGTGPPEDDEPEWYPVTVPRLPGPGEPWQPSRLATPFDRALAAEVADALGDQNADAAVYIDRLARGRREYVWQIRRGFLVAQGLAYP
jgi:hypothetical protein